MVVNVLHFTQHKGKLKKPKKKKRIKKQKKVNGRHTDTKIIKN